MRFLESGLIEPITLGEQGGRFPLLAQIPGHAGEYQILGEGALVVRWKLTEGGDLVLAANLSDTSIAGFPLPWRDLIWHEGPTAEDGCLGPWSVHWSLEPA